MAKAYSSDVVLNHCPVIIEANGNRYEYPTILHLLKQMAHVTTNYSDEVLPLQDDIVTDVIIGGERETLLCGNRADVVLRLIRQDFLKHCNIIMIGKEDNNE